LLRTLAKILPYTLGLYIFLRIYTLMALSQGPFFGRPVLTLLFVLELGCGFILPFFMFASKSVQDDDRRRAIAALLVIFGLILNRFNVSMFGMMDPKHIYYPSLIESLVTIGIIAGHVLFFVLISKYFPIFEHHPEAVDYSIPDSFHKIDDGKPKQKNELPGQVPDSKPASAG